MIGLQKVLADGALEYEAAIAKGHQKDALANEITQLRKRDEVRRITGTLWFWMHKGASQDCDRKASDRLICKS